MEKHILKLIKDRVRIYVYIIIGKEQAAKDITKWMTEFILWKDKTVGLANKDGKYLFWGDYFTVETLYQYWLTNFKS